MSNMNSESEDEEDQIEHSWQGSSGCIVLINCYDPLSRNSAAVAYKATCAMVRKRMRQSSAGLIGICLYGTKDKSDSDVKNLVQIQPLVIPTLDDFNNIISQDISSYEQAKELILSDVLWHCSKMFKQCKKRLGDKTVIMMTSLDIPPSNLNSKLKHQILKRAVDLIQLGIKLKMINVSDGNNEPDEFYKELLIATNNTDAIPKPVWSVDDIQHLMQQYTHRNLALSQLTFDLGNDLSLGVSVYKLVQPCKNPKTAKLDSSSNAVVATTNRMMKIIKESDGYDSSQVLDSSQAETTKEVPALKSEIVYYQMYGSEKIQFTHDELKRVKQPFPPRILKLLGFKPKHILCKEKWFLTQCHFLFPNENLVEGSIVAFKALHKACTDMSMLPICVMCARSSSTPKIVALSPCIKPLNLNIDIGFDVIFIPFLENVKQIPPMYNESERITPAQKTLMKNIMSELKFDFKPDTFENPKLQSMYRAIEALALEEQEVESFPDTTKREPEVYDQINAESFEELFGPFQIMAKRPTPIPDAGSSKKQKQVHIDEEKFERRLNSGHIENFTVPELMEILRQKKPPGLPPITGKKKQELVDIVYKFCRSNQ